MRYVEERHEWCGADPGVVPPGAMHVFMRGDVPHMVDFRCPCGCGATCPTFLTNDPEVKHRPAWTYSAGPTLSPSIRYLGGCKAHFTITNGEAVMHGDSGK